jgi:hypothetical protein
MIVNVSAGFEVFMEVTVKITVLWNVMSYSVMGVQC